MSLFWRGGWIVTQNPRREIVRGDVLVEGGTIATIGQVRDSADRVIDCTNCAVLPGLINTHHHVANTLLRGVADDVPLEGMLEKAYAIDAKLTRRDVQMGALLGCIEMLKSGTTSFHDLFYWEDEVARGARRGGHAERGPCVGAPRRPCGPLPHIEHETRVRRRRAASGDVRGGRHREPRDGQPDQQQRDGHVPGDEGVRAAPEVLPLG